jgi:Cu(I)/Ag(I) efflux system membrane fusion protein
MENPMNDQNPVPPPARRTFGVGGLALAVAASAVVAAGGTWLVTGRGAAPGAPDAHAPGAAPVVEQWQCPMHPSIVQDHPGDCPICGMKLVKVATAGGGGSPGGSGERKILFYRSPMDAKQTSPTPRKDEMGMDYLPVYADELSGGGAPTPEGLAAVTIDPARQQLIGMKIVHAERGPVGGTWRTNGRVAVDETRVHHVNVKFNGFMERVYADFIGKPIQRGEPLYSIYSPELLSAQEEYLLALRTQKTMGGTGGALAGDGNALARAARRKLELWDVPAAEIERIAKAGEASRTVTFYSPASGVLTKKDVVPGMKVSAGDMPFEIIDLSHVWVLADAYETDLGHVKVGMKATLTLKAFADKTFEGRVAFIDPLLDPKTRTAKVRIDFPNPAGDLRPEMFGEVVLAGKARDALRVPADAVIDSGTRSVVFVALPDGKFQPRAVGLGVSDGSFVEVVSGLEAGEGVVTRANFLVDSESRLRASLDALSATTAKQAPAASAPDSPSHAGHRSQP